MGTITNRLQISKDDFWTNSWMMYNTTWNNVSYTGTGTDADFKIGYGPGDLESVAIPAGTTFQINVNSPDIAIYNLYILGDLSSEKSAWIDFGNSSAWAINSVRLVQSMRDRNEANYNDFRTYTFTNDTDETLYFTFQTANKAAASLDEAKQMNENLIEIMITREVADPKDPIIAYSRNEAILKSIIEGDDYMDAPQSRMEALLIELGDLIKLGGVTPEQLQEAINKYLDKHPEIIAGVEEAWLREKLKEVN